MISTPLQSSITGDRDASVKRAYLFSITFAAKVPVASPDNILKGEGNGAAQHVSMMAGFSKMSAKFTNHSAE